MTVIYDKTHTEEEIIMLNELSPPVITAEEDNCIWILECVSLNFDWLHAHINT